MEGIDLWAEQLAGEIEEAVDRLLAQPGDRGLAFSGGIDSSLVAHLAARSGKTLRLYTVGMIGSPDLAASEKAAGLLGLAGRHALLELGEEEVLAAACRIAGLIPGATLLEVSFLAPSYLVFERALERTILTGDGADELFGGYHRYLSMEPAALASSLNKDVEEMVSGGFSRNQRLAASAGKELLAPYLEPDVVALARRIPAEMKVHAGERKAVLRQAAAILGLPPELCALPKRAAQYGSGIHALLTKRHFMR